MPILNCSAVTCVYNKEELCSKENILVGGDNATTANDTCCASFKEKTDSNSSNSTGCGCKNIAVDCDAEKCVHNEDCKCDAAKIGIGGSSACKCEETMCGTFDCK